MTFLPLIDESLVPSYELPPLLSGGGGLEAWPVRRTELLNLFSDHVYGRTPLVAPRGGFHVREDSRRSVECGGTRLQLCMEVGPAENRHRIHILLYLPAMPVRRLFLGVNFAGNHTVEPDPEIPIPEGWMPDWKDAGVVDHRATEAGRGTRTRRWPIKLMLEKGCALATFFAGDIAPDQEGNRETARFKDLFPAPEDASAGWGNIGIWAWALSRVREVLSQLPELRGVPCVAAGHSRLGKTALWAAAQDEGFVGVFSNCSGCLGAALSRRCFGETVGKIEMSYPHWFCPRLADYADREAEMPVDQHMLLALIAPRPLYISSASQDLWVDPLGEFLAAEAASEAYGLYGFGGLAGDSFPALETPLHRDRVGYHIRCGTHDIHPYNWEHALSFFESV